MCEHWVPDSLINVKKEKTHFDWLLSSHCHHWMIIIMTQFFFIVCLRSIKFEISLIFVPWHMVYCLSNGIWHYSPCAEYGLLSNEKSFRICHHLMLLILLKIRISMWSIVIGWWLVTLWRWWRRKRIRKKKFCSIVFT